MESRDFAFAVYTIRVGIAHRNDEDLAAANGVDVFESFKEALRAEVGKPQVGRKELFMVEKLNEDGKERLLWGNVRLGEHGEQAKPIQAIEEKQDGTLDVKKIGDLKRNEVAPDSFFYAIYIPTGKSKMGVMVLQQRGMVCNYTRFSDILQTAISPKNLVLRCSRIAPLAYVNALKNSTLSRITFVKRIKKGDALLDLENNGNFDDVGKVTLIIEPKRNFDLNSFKALFDKVSKARTEKGFLETGLDKLKPTDAKFTVEFANGRQATVRSYSQFVGKPTFHRNIPIGANGPDVDAMKAFAVDIVKEIVTSGI